MFARGAFVLVLALATPLAAEEAPAAAPSLPAITVTSVAAADLTDRVEATGLIRAVETVQVAPQIEGQAIESLMADVGDRVEAGQVLAVLSATALDLNLSQARASQASAEAAIAQARAQLVAAGAARDEAVRVRDRTRALADSGAATRSATESAEAAATSAEAQVTVATQALAAAQAQLGVVKAQIADIELKLARTQVKAPVAGIVTARNATVGAIASAAGQPMFTLIRDGALELRADIPEQDLARLAPGQSALIRVVGAAAAIAGTVKLIEPTVDLATRLGAARIAIDPAGPLRAGQFAGVTIVVAERVAPAIPVSAVGGTSSQASALRVEGDTVHEVAIVTGIRDGGMVEVVSGLAAGDVVVAKAGAFVRDGDHIHPVPATAAAAVSN